MAGIICTELLKELEAEAGSTRKCLEKIPPGLFDYKPHERSMKMEYLAELVAELPKWIAHIIEKNEIDFVTFPHDKASSASDLVKYFDINLEAARKALQSISDEDLEKSFVLKNNGQILFRSSVRENLGSSINHMVHHRGQLTVYMRLNDIPVPSIYGPSADEKTF